MHINNDFNNDIKTQRNAPFQEAREISAKEPETVKTGEVLKGKVVDINSDKVSVRLESGEMISAKLPTESQGSGLGEVKIGDNINMRVIEKNGQQGLEIVISKSDARHNIIGMALNAAGLKLTDENAKLVELLLSNQKPIDANTIKKFNQALKMVGQENVKQALFMLDNDMPITKATAEKVEQYVSREQNIKHQFAALEQAVKEMESGALKDRLTEILTGKSEGQNAEKAAGLVSEHPDEAALKTDAKLAQAQAPSPSPQQAASTAANELPADSPSKTTEASADPKLRPQPQPEVLNLSESAKQAVKSSLISIINLAENFEGTSEQKLMQLMQALEKTPMGKEIMQNINSPDDFKKMLKMVTEGDSELSSKISQIINDDIPEEASAKGREAQLGLKVTKDSTLKELEDFYNNTLSKLASMKEALQQSESPSSSKILSAASDIERNLEFMNAIKNEIYLQAPIIINNLPTQSELFVFKDKKASKKGGQTKSALIALDLLNLGHFETYIQKTGNKVNLQFRLESTEVENLVKHNINKLNLLLKEKGLSVSAVSYKTSEEAFTLVDSEPSFSGDTDSEVLNRRISFDIRM